MKTANDIVDVLIKHWNLSTDADFARKVGIDPDSVLQMRKRKTVDKQTKIIILLLEELREKHS